MDNPIGFASIESPINFSKREDMSGIQNNLFQKAGRLHFRLLAAQAAAAFLPSFFGSKLRARLLAKAGFEIGRGTVFWGMPAFSGQGDIYARLHIGRDCMFNVGVIFDLGAAITIGDAVTVAHEVLLLTSTHEIGPGSRRAGQLLPRPIQIQNGAWLGARCMLLPGVVIGEGAIVAAGAVVVNQVPPHTIVGGVPATVMRSLDGVGERIQL